MATFFLGRLMGFEPTAFGTTIRRSNLLSYNLRFGTAKIENFRSTTKFFSNNFFAHFPYFRNAVNLQSGQKNGAKLPGQPIQ